MFSTLLFSNWIMSALSDLGFKGFDMIAKRIAPHNWSINICDSKVKRGLKNGTDR